jgi:hypothetical protein
MGGGAYYLISSMKLSDLLKGYVPSSHYSSPGLSVEEIFCKLEPLKVSLVLSLLNIMIMQPSAARIMKERERERYYYDQNCHWCIVSLKCPAKKLVLTKIK